MYHSALLCFISFTPLYSALLCFTLLYSALLCFTQGEANDAMYHVPLVLAAGAAATAIACLGVCPAEVSSRVKLE